MEFKLEQIDAREYMLVISEINVDEGPDRLSLWLDHDEAVQLFKTCEESIGEWVAEYRRHEAIYEATKHAHEDEQDGGGYEPDDPKSEGYYERVVDLWDSRPGK